jgi:hypothetical protein
MGIIPALRLSQNSGQTFHIWSSYGHLQGIIEGVPLQNTFDGHFV